MTSRRPWQIAFAIGVVVQVLALYWPRPPSVDTGLPLDKVVHFALFAAVTYVGRRAGLGAWLVASLMAGQAMLSEAIQHFWLDRRSGDVWDLVADVAGIAAALWVTRERPHSAGPVPETP